MRVRLLICYLIISCFAIAPRAAGQVKRALLVGINTYQPANTAAQHADACQGGRCDLPVFDNLSGSLNDVAAMRDMLSSPKFGFDPRNIVLLTTPELPSSQLPYETLPAAGTSHAGLVAAMRKYLVDVPAKGDTLVFYYAGHGSLRVNNKGTKLSMLVDGRPAHVDSTLVPSDAWTGNFDIRDREMTDIFQQALDRGVKLTVILDSCHSGSFTRGVEPGRKYVERYLPFDPRDIDEAPAKLANGEERPAPSQRKDNPALIFSAAQQDQTAKELKIGDSPDAPVSHGAFTVALIKALQTLPADAPAADVYHQVRATLEGERVGNQTPSVDATKERLSQPIFGGASGDLGKARAAAVESSKEGEVTLDAGRLSDINVGSEFLSITTDQAGERTRLRVESQEGITRSRAKVTSPIKAQVPLGEVFELDKWVPQQIDRLQIWTWPANLTLALVQDVAEKVRESGIRMVEDPIEQHWTDMLAWNGAGWELRRGGRALESPIAGKPRTTSLGPSFTASALKHALGANASLWANLPPPQEIGSTLSSRAKESGVVAVDEVDDADYVLAGSMRQGNPAWAWVHKSELMAATRQESAVEHSAGCSTESSYPISTDYVPVTSSASMAEATAKLNEFANRLTKVHGWLNLVGDPFDASIADHYRLVLKRVADNSVVAETDAATQDERLKMYLTSDRPPLQSRWVYVLDIDCHGRGTLLFPRDTSENRFPNNARGLREMELPGAPTLRISAPYGMETILLISTKEPLPDPYLLNFDGVRTGGIGARAALSPLQQLLANTSAGVRGAPQEVPKEWSVDALKLRTVPRDSHPVSRHNSIW